MSSPQSNPASRQAQPMKIPLIKIIYLTQTRYIILMLNSCLTSSIYIHYDC
jgi:hypothetical protein